MEQAPVLSAFGRLNHWEWACHALTAAEVRRRFPHASVVRVPGLTAAVDVRRLQDPDEARRLLDLVCEIAFTLRALAAASPAAARAAGDTPLLVTQHDDTAAITSSEIWVHHGVVRTERIDPFKEFLAALEGINAERLRQCPVCRHLFFALRKDQKACAKRCNAARRVREWRAQQARHEYRRKLRKAGEPP
jgi:hypothetical protein